MRRGVYLFFTLLLLFAPMPIYAQDELVLGGNSVGIEIRYDGLYVSGTYPINEQVDPSDTFQPGDIIQSVDHQPMEDLSTFYSVLKEHTDPVNEIAVTILRDDRQIDTMMQSVYDEQRHCVSCGLYIKEKMSGVGTMTFYDPSTERFGALGHAIEQLDDDLEGNLYDAKIIDYTKAKTTDTGEKKADILYDDVIATIDQNTPIGIYGEYQELPDTTTSLPWATSEEVVEGDALIYTVLEDQSIQSFAIEITDLHPNTQDDMKGISFTVTDKELLEKTGGIIQGMSGSPIVQNGKIVGAVTHVVTASPQDGYGVFIEYMLKHTRSS